MAYTTRNSLHGGASKRNSSPAIKRRGPISGLIGALAGAAIAFATIALIILGAGHVVAVSIAARSDIRAGIALAPQSSQLAWASPAADETTGPAVAMASSAPEPLEPSAETAASPETIEAPAPAIVVADASDNLVKPLAEPPYTGSIALDPPTLVMGYAATDAVSEKRTAFVDVLAPPLPLPLPRRRPRLAALPPAGDIVIKPEEDARSPRTAIYDIAAQTVYLPSGERLEAHSGLGGLMDDPRSVRTKNRGATPPNTYQLKLRESLFHGVQAIRLTPAGDGNMFGRDGILAHSYMLGPSGQSNGCVSFRDYAKFLRAYQRGEIDRLVVVSRLPNPPAFAARRKVHSAANTL
jgi:hypothetical protein